MLSFTRKTDYGLQLMAVLAENYGGEIVPLVRIAKDKKLPLKYLEQIALLLKQAKLVRPKEGKGGGYYLVKDPRMITVTQVVEAIEGPTEISHCCGCPNALGCGQKNVWDEVQSGIEQTMGDKTVADLIKGKRKKNTITR